MKKRIIALILTLSLVLSMGISVFAADSSATITITDEDGNVLDISGTIILTEEGSGKTAEELEAELEELEYLNSSYGFFVWLSENDSITEAQREEAATAAGVLIGTLGDVPTFTSGMVATYEELVEALPIGEGTTSMENLIVGIHMVEYTNELRQIENEEEGRELDDYLISPILTACEELVINYNAAYDYQDGHLGLFKFPSENLVSGSVYLLSDYSWAFYYWYTVEKSSSGGHYRAIIDSNIETTGAAGATYGNFAYYGMAFNLDRYYPEFGYTENAYTTDEFYALAMEYQSEIESEIAAVEDELEGLEEIAVTITNGKASADVSDGTYAVSISGLEGHGTVAKTVTVSNGTATVVLTDEEAESITEHDYVATVTEATCTKEGYTTYTCSVCGDTYTDDYVEALGHSYDDGVWVQEFSCTEGGILLYTCTRCGWEYAETWGAVTGDGVITAGHSYDDGVVTKEATCTEEGEITYTCSVCGDTYTESIAATGHSYDDGVITLEPTCTEEGEITYTCSSCGDTYTESIATTDHTLVEAGGVEATCTEDGYITYVCSVCGETVTETIEALGHDYVLTGTAAEATCTEDGWGTYVCSICGEFYEGVIEATGHTEGEAVIENNVEATCTEDGSYESVVYCTICGEELSRETVTVDASGHSWDEGVVTKEATEDEDGVVTYTCSVCGETYTESIEYAAEAEETEETTEESEEDDDAAATGDTTRTLFWMILAGIATACGAVSFKRKFNS